MLLPNADELTARTVASRLVDAIEAPFSLDGQQVAVGASVGIAVHPLHGHDAGSLMRRADAAMYAAKRTRSAEARAHALATSVRTA